jgi:nitrogen regulatory protein PII 1
MESRVVESLERQGCISLTKMEVFGRGKQKGVHIADIHYDELQKTLLLMVVEDEHKDRVIQTIMESARTGKFGDGRIFVSPVEEAYTIRTGKPGL